MFQRTFSTASSDLSTYVPVPMEKYGAESMRVYCTMADATVGDEVTIDFAMVVNGDRIASFPATVTAVAAANTAGDLMGTVVFGESGRSVLDAMGVSKLGVDALAVSAHSASSAVWKVGMTVKGGTTTSIEVYIATSKEI